jgi:hypothetical protein
VDNLAPSVDIPDIWLVSEPGALTVEERGVGLDGVEVVIRNGNEILHSRVYHGSEVPSDVNWDGEKIDGTLVTPGEYNVVVFAWDLVGNKGSDAGRIVVPAVEQASAPALPAPVDPAEPSKPFPAPAFVESGAEAEADVAAIQDQPWIWPAIAWIGLLSAVGIAKVSDPRVSALRSLHDELSVIRKSLNE